MGYRPSKYSMVAPSSIPAQKRSHDNRICRDLWKGLYGWLQRIQEREQLLLLLFSELSEAPGHVLCLASVPFNGIF